MLELSCKAFAPPAPRLTLVQEIVKEKMQHHFPGAQLGVKSWPSLLQRYEQAAEAAEQWEPPADDPNSDEEEDMCEALCDEHKDDGCRREQRAAMSRLMVAKLNQSMVKGTAYHINSISNWLAWFCDLPQYLGGMVAAGAPHALVKVLQGGPDEAKGDAGVALANIADHCRPNIADQSRNILRQEQHVGAVVAAGAIEACVAVMQTGPDDVKKHTARTLANIAHREQHVDALVAAGAIEACVTVLQTGSDYDGAKQNAASTLENIARQEQHVDAVAAAGAIEACVAVLQTGPDEAKMNAAGTLANISYHEQYMGALVAAGAIGACTAMVQTGPDNAKCNGSLALANIAHHEQHVGAVVAAGAVEVCVAMLQSGPDEAKGNAAFTLATISNSRHKQHVGAVVASGAIVACTAVVQTGPNEAKGDAMCVLAHISYCEQHAGAVAAAGAVTAILDTMHSMDSEDKYYAALVLANFSDRLSATAVAHVVAALVQELNVDPEELDEFDIVRGLSRISQHEQHVDAVVAGGTVAILTRVIQCTGSQRVKNEATNVLNLISEAERIQRTNKAQKTFV